MSGPENPFHRCIFLTGPTASGKTAIGIELARLISAEIVALDSMTLYRGMDIGTAKPTPGERLVVPHHLIDVIDPWESASVALYRAWAQETVAAIESRGHKVLFVGGTPLYLKALLRGLFEGPAAEPELRRTLEDEAGQFGNPALHARLAAIDPATAARLHPNDRRRVVRALEVAATTGRPLSLWQAEHEFPAPPSVPVFALARPRDELNKRIDTRVVQIFKYGLIDEARRLRALPQPIDAVPAQGIGYKEAFDLIDERLGLNEAVARVQLRTRQMAKRQRTWFRGLSEVRPWPLPEGQPPGETAGGLSGAIEALTRQN